MYSSVNIVTVENRLYILEYSKNYSVYTNMNVLRPDMSLVMCLNIPWYNRDLCKSPELLPYCS